MNTNMSPQDIEQHQEQVYALAAQLAKAAQGAKHTLLLEALMRLYLVIAEAHGCCTRPAALACVAAAARLQKATLQTPADAVLH